MTCTIEYFSWNCYVFTISWRFEVSIVNQRINLRGRDLGVHFYLVWSGFFSLDKTVQDTNHCSQSFSQRFPFQSFFGDKLCKLPFWIEIFERSLSGERQNWIWIELNGFVTWETRFVCGQPGKRVNVTTGKYDQFPK